MELSRCGDMVNVIDGYDQYIMVSMVVDMNMVIVVTMEMVMTN